MPERTFAESRRSAERSAELARRENDQPRPEGRPAGSPAIGFVPVGCCLPWDRSGSEAVPAGWAIADGSTCTDLRSRRYYGGALPDLRARFVVGQKDSDDDFGSVGDVGGRRAIEVDDHSPSDCDHVNVIDVGGQVVEDPYVNQAVVVFNGTPSGGQGVTGGAKDTDGSSAWFLEHAGRATGPEGSDLEGTHSGTGGSGTVSIPSLPPYYVLVWIVRIF